jgi:predicted type IV restriction endonuclease
MPIDKPTLGKLKKFAKVFADARDRDANESDTVMYLIEFFKEVLDYDPLGGEISKEVSINDRYCDFGIRLDDKIAFLVEAKPAGVKSLKPKHIEQAENYGSRSGISWVLLTNGVMWQLYHLTFGNGIEHELVFELNLLDDLELRPDWVWDTLSVLNKRNVREESLDTYYEQQKLLSPKNVVNLLLDEEMLMKLRQELNRKAPTRLDLTTVFEAVRDVLSQEALASAGDIVPPARKKHRRRQRKTEDGVEEEPGEEGGSVPAAQAELSVEKVLPAAQGTVAPSAQEPAAPPPPGPN